MRIVALPDARRLITVLATFADGTATVTAVIPDATYRPVINGMAELHTLGRFQRWHPERSADRALQYYRVSDDVAALIHHHDTPLSDLPEEFPAALVPMLRIMQLVGALSAVRPLSVGRHHFRRT